MQISSLGYHPHYFCEKIYSLTEEHESVPNIMAYKSKKTIMHDQNSLRMDKLKVSILQTESKGHHLTNIHFHIVLFMLSSLNIARILQLQPLEHVNRHQDHKMN